MNQQCKVCGEPAAGFHFGAFTCEGCKSFFGRSYNNLNSIAECKNGGECVINKKNRTACKACRLRKCLHVGMSKSGSRYGRRSNWFKIHCLLQQQQQQQIEQQQQQQQQHQNGPLSSNSDNGPSTRRPESMYGHVSRRSDDSAYGSYQSCTRGNYGKMPPGPPQYRDQGRPSPAGPLQQSQSAQNSFQRNSPNPQY